MLIVPDVHGRVFWKEPLAKYPEDDVIFLGDYLDPYTKEGITPGDAYEVFGEVLEAKRKNPTRVTLLLGNHDLMYLDPVHKSHSDRHDMRRESDIAYLFLEALKEDPEFFKLAEIRENYVFSHAGIHPCWLSQHPEFGVGIKEAVEKINNTLWESSTLLSLCEYSKYRGGWGGRGWGSPVWSDVREWVDRIIENPEGVIQVFGHTQLKEGKIIEGKCFKCIDCKHVIKIDKNNQLEIL